MLILRGSPVTLLRRARSGGATWNVKRQIVASTSFDLADEAGVGIEARHLVFVLVGHQLEQIARDRLCKSLLPGARAASAARAASTRRR